MCTSQSVVALCFVATLAGAPAYTQGREDGQWTMPAKNYAGTRYSGLPQITAANVVRLKPVWSFSTGVLGGHEGQPLVVNRTMYVVTPYPNVLYAFDLTREGYPLKWKYRPDPKPAAIGIACCDTINRGPAYTDGKLVYNLLDGHTVAVDADTGRELWKTKVAEIGDVVGIQALKTLKDPTSSLEQAGEILARDRAYLLTSLG
jgi:glucose dehydrogenase